MPIGNVRAAAARDDVRCGRIECDRHDAAGRRERRTGALIGDGVQARAVGRKRQRKNARDCVEAARNAHRRRVDDRDRTVVHVGNVHESALRVHGQALGGQAGLDDRDASVRVDARQRAGSVDVAIRREDSARRRIDGDFVAHRYAIDAGNAPRCDRRDRERGTLRVRCDDAIARIDRNVAGSPAAGRKQAERRERRRIVNRDPES